MANMKDNCHVLLVAFPAQGQINPSLQFAKRLIKLGVKVTFSTSLSAMNCMSNRPSIEGLTFAPFSDGYDNGYPNFNKSLDKFQEFYASFITLGSEFVAKIFTARAKEGRPFSRIIYTSVLSWVGIVAKRLNAPAILLWIQPATLLDIYYYYFIGYRDDFKNCLLDDQPMELPGLPFPVGTREIPSFLLSSDNLMYWLIQRMKEHVESINSEANEIVLVNTFDTLDRDALRAIKNVNMVGIGPLIPSHFLDGEDSFDTAYGGDLRHCSKDYMDWLNSTCNASVVYVAFGSYSELPNQMMEEIARGLVKSKRPFLWVIRNGQKPFENLSCKEELEKQGKIVSWCCQVEVLPHPSLGCFLSHCGWNSTLESLVSGIPVVACPLWVDQGCNSKLVQDVWKIGVRVNANEEGVIEGAEFKRCIDIVMGDGKERKELRNNAKKWKDLAKDSMKEDGSSNVNLKAYVHEVLGSRV
ncbi:UDP-glycosyltransferase 75C1-like [Lycium ferocissimum]|uniref:UDP-glycosyltransferase 75C1-like n=1 Tax=Lycium ferocissimum TaxID=112874 RepID=UPI002814EB13|nr:UDP-glycosyltransferase 75C1-like [Lycium ferocissimum]